MWGGLSHDSEINGHTLYQLSQPYATVFIHFLHQVKLVEDGKMKLRSAEELPRVKSWASNSEHTVK